MLVWYIGVSVALVHEVFRSRGLDYRLVAAGAVLPLLVDLPFGRFSYGHSLLVAVLLLAAVIVGTIGRSRLTRRRLVCLPIGYFCGLVLSGAFLHDVSFLWPALGNDFPDVSLFPPLAFGVLLDAAGIAVIAWCVQRFGLTNPECRHRFFDSGRLEEVHR